MQQNFAVFILMAFIIVVLTFAQAFTPYLTRKTQCFGISIPENQFDNPVFKSYRKIYKKQNLIMGIVSIVVLFLAAFIEMYFVFIYIAVLFLNIIISFLLYYRFYKKVREYKEKSDWKDQTSTVVAATIRSENKTFINKAWLLIYPVIIIITAAYSLLYFSSLPNKIAMQYDFYGNVTRYVEKSMLTVLFMPMVQIFIAVIFCFVFFVIKNSRRQIDAQNKEQSERKVDIFRKVWGYFTVFGGAALMIMMMLIQLSMFNVVPIEVTLTFNFVLLVAIFIGVTIISIKVGQGGSRLLTKGDKGAMISVKDDDRYWKMGSFYVNPDDPALFVEKRFGIGWTINFGRPAAFVIMGIFVVFIVLIMVLSLMIK